MRSESNFRLTKFTRVLTSTLLVAVSLLSASDNSAADGPVDEAAVRRLVARLDVDRKSDRQAAETELIQLGPAVLSWLPEPQSLGSRSAAEAVKRVRMKLERVKAESAVDATRVTVGESQSVANVLSRVTRDTGNAVEFDALPMSILAKQLDWSERPTFWDVVDGVTRAGPVTWQFEKNPARLRLLSIRPRDPNGVSADEAVLAHEAVAVAQSQAFRVALKSVRSKIVVGEEAGQLARLEFDVACEPRLRPLFVTCASADLQVSGEAANKTKTDWLAFVPDTKLELSFGQGRRQLSLPFDFRIPAGERGATLSVSGQMHVLTAAGEEPLDFPAGAESRGMSRRRGGVKVSVRNWEVGNTANGPTVTVEALVEYDASGIAFESHRTWMLSNVAGLLGPQPTMLLPADAEVESQPNGSIRVQYRFENLPCAANELRFRYVAPTLLLDVPLTFKFPEIAWPDILRRP